MTPILSPALQMGPQLGNVPAAVLRHLLAVAEARELAERPTRALAAEAIEELAAIYAVGERPALGWWRRHKPRPSPGLVRPSPETIAAAVADLVTEMSDVFPATAWADSVAGTAIGEGTDPEVARAAARAGMLAASVEAVT